MDYSRTPKKMKYNLITACVRLFIVAAVIVVIVVFFKKKKKNINQNKSSYFVLGTGFE